MLMLLGLLTGYDWMGPISILMRVEALILRISGSCVVLGELLLLEMTLVCFMVGQGPYQVLLRRR